MKNLLKFLYICLTIITVTILTHYLDPIFWNYGFLGNEPGEVSSTCILTFLVLLTTELLVNPIILRFIRNIVYSIRRIQYRRTKQRRSEYLKSREKSIRIENQIRAKKNKENFKIPTLK